MEIEVNNGCTMNIEHVGQGIHITSEDEHGGLIRSDWFGESEIVSAVNLLRYMKDCGDKSAYLIDEWDASVLRILKHDLIEEFRILE